MRQDEISCWDWDDFPARKPDAVYEVMFYLNCNYGGYVTEQVFNTLREAKDYVRRRVANGNSRELFRIMEHRRSHAGFRGIGTPCDLY